jgi:allophanate hydrolase subunit 1
MKLAADPNRIRAELIYNREQSASEQHLVRQALAGLHKEIERLKRQKSELLDLYLNRERSSIPLTRDEYETKARQLAQQLEQLEAQQQEMQGQMKADTTSSDQIEAALELLEAVRAASERATFRQRRAILSILEIQVLYNGETIQMTGAIPTQSILLESLRDQSFTDESSSPLLQSEPSDGSLAAEAGNSIFEDQKRNTDCTTG